MLIMVAAGIIAFLAFVVLAVDLGRLAQVKSALRNTADAASLAGASGLPRILGGEGEAQKRLKDIASKNPAGGSQIAILPEQIKFMNYDFDAKTYSPDPIHGAFNSVSVTAARSEVANGPVQSLFGSVFGVHQTALDEDAVATVGPANVFFLVDLRQEIVRPPDPPPMTVCWCNDTVCGPPACPGGVPPQCDEEEFCPCPPDHCACRRTCVCPDEGGGGHEPPPEPCQTCATTDGLKQLALQALNKYLGGLPPTLVGSVAFFGPENTAGVGQSWTKDAPAVERTLQSLQAVPGVAVNVANGLADGLVLFHKGAELAGPGRTFGVLVFNADMGLTRSPMIERLIEEAKEKHRPLFILALGTGQNPTIAPGQLTDFEFLKWMAEHSRGALYRAPSGSDLNDATRKMATDLPTHLTR